MEHVNTVWAECKNSVRTSQETHDVPATKPNLLMLFREIITVYCENHTEDIVTLKSSIFWHMTLCCHYPENGSSRFLRNVDILLL
jgi:hypothetical protein